MEGNLADVLARRADTYGWRDRPLFHAGEAVFSHGEVHDAAARAAGVLHAVGIRPGHRVLLALPDSVAFVTALLGTLRLGAVAVLAGPEQSEAEHAHLLADADPQAVVCAPELVGRFPAVHAVTGEDLTDEPAMVPEPVAVEPGAPAYVQYTSGTTGPPKGVVHRHSDPLVYLRALGIGALGVRSDDVVFSLSKACYPFGLGASVFFPMLAGCSAVLWERQPSVAGAVEQARRHRPTLLFTVPTWYARLVGAPDAAAPVRAAFSSLRAALSAGEPLLPSLADRIEEVLGCPVLDGLGSTEVGHTFVSNTVTRRRRGTLGTVLDPFEIAVRVEHGQGGGPPVPARTGETGVLYVRGPSVMREYLGRPEQTAEVLSPDGWLRTGDLVHVDEEGFVHHHGRLLDQVTLAGHRVTPLKVERVLGQHPAVVEVVVVPGPGDVPGAEGVLRAFAVLEECAVREERALPLPDLAEDLLAFARERLPAHEVPQSVTFLAELPRTATGKIRRSALGRDR
ncbi:class I adenylate-forming enzyme family protein [Actinomadura hibisca]|uniref:class I adenylate-forming enzyme family protein n=1 Tax=Actinomadura hibisca TaxID=68565 RepID=UPI000830E999|nr:AMP-binding protein [Actinomadura hibisca]